MTKCIEDDEEEESSDEENEEEREVPAELSERLELKTVKEVAPEWFDCSKPRDLKVNKVSNTGRIFLSFIRNIEQERVLAENGFGEKITYKALLQKKGGEDSGIEHSLRKEEEGNCFSFVPDLIEEETAYTVKVKAEPQGKQSEWSEEAEFTTPKFSEYCAWKECPGNVNVEELIKYSVDEMNPRIATKINGGGYCTIIGNTPLPHNKVTSWSIKILKSCNNGSNIYIGVAPFDVNQNEEGCNCGWYFDCYCSTLWSGPPHNYRSKEYGPRKEDGKYVHTGDSVGVVMDTAKGELSFVVNGVNHGAAYDGIPLDKPLVPCVLLGCDDDSVELII